MASQLTNWLREWPRPAPGVDHRLVGITFVDVLFALVIARVLDPLSNFGQLPIAGLLHLSVAGVLTLLSWIGYHNSLNRPTYFIRFPNLPLLQVLIDVSLVVVYWLTAVSAEAPRCTQYCASALPEARLIAISFLLYAVWDQVAKLIRRDPRYAERPETYDVPRRRRVTGWCLFLSAVTYFVVWATNPTTTTPVVVWDAWLIVLVVGFRLAKEYVTPAKAYPTDTGG